MIKRTLYFGNPAYLRTKDEQLCIEFPEGDKEARTVPIEDIGVVILDHYQVTLSQALIGKLMGNNVALITCNEKHMPTGLMLNLDGHTLQSQRFREQLEATEPVKKNLWQQTVKSKIKNQAALLKKEGEEIQNMLHWAEQVKSGDSENHEARASVWYWQNLFKNHFPFNRDPLGPSPNNLLNYAYAILRATVARSLVGSGLLPTLGIFHRNQYNAYCLADDIMEPYRPMVDQLVLELVKTTGRPEELTPAIKKELLAVPTLDVEMEGEKSPLMVAVQRTTASLARCFAGGSRKMAYPELI